MKLGDVGTSRSNNFDAVRLFAALLVLVSHGYALAGRPDPHLAGSSLGSLGVYIFFGISGFLVTQSWMLQPNLGSFVAKRALRILPALIVVSLATAYLIGPLVTTLPLGQYFGDSQTHAYALHNSILRTEYVLPGVFAHNPYPYVANGSLWTLPIEVRAYVAVAGLGLLIALIVGRAHRAEGVRAPAAVLIAVVALFGLVLGADAAGLGLTLPSRGELTGGFARQEPLLLVFAAGALLYLCRDRVALRWDAFASVIGLWLVVARWHLVPDEVLPALVFPYATLVIAFRGSHHLRRLTRRGDISYGVYLWAFPVTQLVASVLGGSNSSPAKLIALSLPLTCVVAMASWLLVERPVLRFKPGRRVVPTPKVGRQEAVPLGSNSIRPDAPPSAAAAGA